MEPSAMIRLEGISKTYRSGEIEFQALHGVSLQVAEGEFIAILGSSGSGKSTLMNVIGCLDRPSEGRYLLEDVDVSRMDRRELAAVRNRRIGFVFQSFNLLARTTALENVELPLLYNREFRGTNRVQIAREALERVGLADKERNYPNQLSGGQQQRVAIARALVSRPAILLADEPTGNLDSATSSEIMSLFEKLNRSGITIVLVTHEQDISRYARRHVVLRDGQVVEDRRFEGAAR